MSRLRSLSKMALPPVVLVAVGFHDELLLLPEEVDDVGTDADVDPGSGELVLADQLQQLPLEAHVGLGRLRVEVLYCSSKRLEPAAAGVPSSHGIELPDVEALHALRLLQRPLKPRR